MKDLASRSLQPYSKQLQRLDAAGIAQYLAGLPGWEHHVVNDIDQLQRTYTFPDFAEALQFTNQVADLAETANHHPTLVTSWGKVTVTWWTHVIHGLHENDFIMAARCDALLDRSVEAD